MWEITKNQNVKNIRTYSIKKDKIDHYRSSFTVCKLCQERTGDTNKLNDFLQTFVIFINVINKQNFAEEKFICFRNSMS